jgi:glycosyltransferase involved in cell wall biosynthesis
MLPRLDIISPLLPTRPLVGGSAHIVGAARQLARSYTLRLFALAPDPAAPPDPALAACAEVHVVARGRPRGAWLLPPAVRLDRSAVLADLLCRAWAQARPELVQIEFTTMAQYARLARATGAAVVCTAHNAGFLAQMRRARRERDPRRAARRWAGALSLWAYERRALRVCDLVVAHSPADAAALRRWLPGVPVVYLPSGVDLEERPVLFDPRAADEVLFVGSFQHPPNVDGACWLAREVWPLVRAARPTARLTLAGRGPGPGVRALAAFDVRVPGTLDDLRPLYAQASLLAAPIFWGGGVRVKILDALAHGLPLVTTPAAAEGIPLRDGESALFAETPSAFAAAVLQLLDDAALRARLGAAGRALVEQRYDWERIGRRLRGLYAGLRQAEDRAW